MANDKVELNTAAPTVGNYERGIELMHQLWGAETTEKMRAIWQEASPDVERYITAFALGEVWARPGLDLKTRSLVTLAAAIALEREGQIRLHTQGALRSGATPQEISEAVIQLMVYASFPAGWQAMVVVKEEIQKYNQSSTHFDNA